MYHPQYGSHVKYVVWKDSPAIYTGITERRIFENGMYYFEIKRDDSDSLDTVICNDIIAYVRSDDK